MSGMTWSRRSYQNRRLYPIGLLCYQSAGYMLSCKGVCQASEFASDMPSCVHGTAAVRQTMCYMSGMTWSRQGNQYVEDCTPSVFYSECWVHVVRQVSLPLTCQSACIGRQQDSGQRTEDRGQRTEGQCATYQEWFEHVRVTNIEDSIICYYMLLGCWVYVGGQVRMWCAQLFALCSISQTGSRLHVRNDMIMSGN